MPVVRPIVSQHDVELGSATPSLSSTASGQSAVVQQMEQVLAFGGEKGAGARFTLRERIRRSVLTTVKWQALILLAAVLDVTMLAVEAASTVPEAASVACTCVTKRSKDIGASNECAP